MFNINNRTITDTSLIQEVARYFFASDITEEAAAKIAGIAQDILNPTTTLAPNEKKILLVEWLITQEKPVDIKDLEKITQIYNLSFNDQQEMFFALIETKDLSLIVAFIKKNKAYANAQNETGQTPLHWAVSQGHKDAIETLLNEGAKINLSDENGLTPLHWAASQGHKDAIEVLLDRKNIEVNAVAKDGLTPLHWAALNGHKDAIKILLDREDIEINAADKNGLTPLHWAISQDHKDAIETLLDRDNIEVNAADKNGLTPLHFAVENGRKDVIKALLDKGADINAKTTNNGSTPLHWAAEKGHKDAIEALLNRDDIEVNAGDKNALTPLHWAALNDHKDAIEVLLNNKADVNASDKNGSTPLHFAAENGRKDVIELLLNGKALVNAQNNDGVIPLYWAVLNNHKDAIETFLDKGADINAKTTNNGSTPLHWAAEKGHKDAIEVLLDKGADINAKTTNNGSTPLHFAAEKGHKDAIELLLNGKALVNAQNNDGIIPLYWAVLNNHKDAIQTLLDKGADINARTINNGSTPLHWAAENGHKDAIEVLLDNGADVNIKSYLEETTLDILLQTSNPRTMFEFILNKYKSNKYLVSSTIHFIIKNDQAAQLLKDRSLDFTGLNLSIRTFYLLWSRNISKDKIEEKYSFFKILKKMQVSDEHFKLTPDIPKPEYVRNFFKNIKKLAKNHLTDDELDWFKDGIKAVEKKDSSIDGFKQLNETTRNKLYDDLRNMLTHIYLRLQDKDEETKKSVFQALAEAFEWCGPQQVQDTAQIYNTLMPQELQLSPTLQILKNMREDLYNQVITKMSSIIQRWKRAPSAHYQIALSDIKRKIGIENLPEIEDPFFENFIKQQEKDLLVNTILVQYNPLTIIDALLKEKEKNGAFITELEEWTRKNKPDDFTPSDQLLSYVEKRTGEKNPDLDYAYGAYLSTDEGKASTFSANNIFRMVCSLNLLVLDPRNRL